MTNNETTKDCISLMKSLRAVRQFRPDPIPEEVVQNLLEVVRWSGSASNRQPWELVIIRNRQTLQALAKVEGYAGHLAGAAMGIILVMAGDREQIEQETFDEGRLSERIMLAAAAFSVGSSVGWFRGRGVTEAKRILEIPEQRLVRTAVSLGYPDKEAQRNHPKPAQARKSLSEIVHEERYS